ncbi:hypothetical protein BC834DRAFT_959004 [Gloeopeniophorella convolvens]|nr:hypothetical protein BC834DRAFT_959004 [Gloeopeniophorella convolvens]
MNGTQPHPRTPSSSGSGASGSRFKEHLSISMPPPDMPVERSHFSPDSPPPPLPSEHKFSLSGSTMYKASPPSHHVDLEKGSHSGSSPRSAGFSIRGRFTRLFGVDLRTSRRSSAERSMSVRGGSSSDHAFVPKLPEWSPLNVRKQPHHCTCQQLPHYERARNPRRRALRVALAILLLYFFINVLLLDIRVFAPSHMPPQLLLNATSPPASAPMTTDALSADTQQCIAQYTLDAPGDPTGYPCGTCLPLLAALPPSATAVYPAALDAAQFCGLRALWEDAGQQGQAALEGGGWVKDVKFCAWNGVRCDGAGRVSSLQLSFPAVPASLPAEFTNLTALETLEISGDGNSPAGPFPGTFGALTKLSSLHLESTALGALPDTLQNLSALTLVRNTQLGITLPPSAGSGNLRTLVVNNEALTLSAAQSTALCSGQLQTCDLRGSGIQACGTCLVG